MRVVFDTNVLISAFLVPGGHGERALLLAIRRRFRLCTSVAILTETANKLRGKFGQSDADIKQALRLISRHAEVLRPALRVDVLEDQPDNRILECAVAAGADLVVTGDRHLLRLRTFRGIPIVRLRDLIRSFPDELS
jgi:putative PIN family toxin of toxin-antitoxin system